MKVTFCLVLLICIVTSQKRPRYLPQKIPKELKCYQKGFFKCQTGVRRARLQTICSEYEGLNRIAWPIPKERKEFNGTCPILATPIPKFNLTEVELPDCPCVDGNKVSNFQDMFFQYRCGKFNTEYIIYAYDEFQPESI